MSGRGWGYLNRSSGHLVVDEAHDPALLVTHQGLRPQFPITNRFTLSWGKSASALDPVTSTLANVQTQDATAAD